MRDWYEMKLLSFFIYPFFSPFSLSVCAFRFSPFGMLMCGGVVSALPNDFDKYLMMFGLCLIELFSKSYICFKKSVHLVLRYEWLTILTDNSHFISIACITAKA